MIHQVHYINFLSIFSFHVETSCKNNGNELKSPLDVFSISWLYPFPKTAPHFPTILLVKEFFASFLTTSVPFPNKPHRRKKSKKNYHTTSQEKQFSVIRHLFGSLVRLCLLWFLMRVLLFDFPHPSTQLIFCNYNTFRNPKR